MPLDQIPQREMSFLDHLEELRWHIIRALFVIIIFAIAAFIAKDFVVGTVILGPSQANFWTYQQLCKLATLIETPALCVDTLSFELVSRKLTSQFMTHLSISFFMGLILGFPYLFWEIWRFIKPGLQAKERKSSRGATFSVSILFTLGVLFGYFMIVPISIRFFSTYQVDPSLQNLFDFSSYISIFTLIVFGTGLLFQLPVIVYFLTKAGIVNAALMQTYRKHAIIVILILGAVITPPDPFSQILIALPLMMLYQISIIIAKKIEKKEKA